MMFLLKFQSLRPETGTRWRTFRIVESNSGTSFALTARKASRSRSIRESLMEPLLRRPGHGRSRRRFAILSVPLVIAAQLLATAGQARLHGRERDTLHLR